jgi:hypothetical protein
MDDSIDELGIIKSAGQAIIGKLGCQLHLVVYAYNIGLLPMILLNSDVFNRFNSVNGEEK